MSYPEGPSEPGRAAHEVRPYLRGLPEDEAAPEPPPRDQKAAAGGSGLRPFVLTSGRVDGLDPSIQMETQVSARPGALPIRLPPEKRAIVSLCVQPLSVAEISARLHMHLGVVRILVEDLQAAGQLDVHLLDEEFPDSETIMRVIRGLQKIA